MSLDATIGGPNSDSYGTEAEATTYHTSMGNASWTGTTGELEAALRRAAVWLDGAYRDRWPGSRLNGRNQSRDWPRVGAQDIEGFDISSTTIPSEVVKAQFEAALIELVSPGTLSPTLTKSQIVKSEKVGPISVEYAVSESSVMEAAFPVVGVVERLLSGIVTDGSEDEYPAAIVL